MLFDDAQTPALTQENYLSITEYFNLENADNSRKARTLFSLSVLFTRYSSSGRLGTENNSLLVLRYYAYALMSKAWELDNTVIREADFREWGNKLLGRDGAFTCTSVLADYQSRVALERFPNIYKSIVPANLIM